MHTTQQQDLTAFPQDLSNPANVADALLAWLRRSTEHLIGTVRNLCGTDPHFAELWDSLSHDIRRKTGQAFYRLVRESARRQGEAHVQCINLPGAPKNEDAIYEVTPVHDRT